MTDEQIAAMPIESIIKMPNFIALEKSENYNIGPQYRRHWVITFKCQFIDGKFLFFNKMVPFDRYRIIKFF